MRGVKFQATLALLLSVAVAVLAVMSVATKLSAPASPVGDEVPFAARLLREGVILVGAISGSWSAVMAGKGEQKYVQALPVLLPLLGVMLGFMVFKG